MLTKAFVVLVTILSVLMVALFTAYATQTGDLRAELAAAETKARLAEQSAAQATQDLQAVQQTAQDLRQARQSEVAQLTAQINDLQKANDNLRSDLNEQQTRNDRLYASMEGLKANSDQTIELLQAKTEQLEALRTEDVAQRERLIEQADRIAALESERSGLVDQVRRLREQAMALQSENARMEQMLANAGIDRDEPSEGSQGPVLPAHRIWGQVANVDRAGTLLIEINVGSNDNVQVGMPFVISRDGEFIGEMVIEEVEQNSAVGTLTLNGEGQVQPGDTVFAGPELGATARRSQ